MQWYIFFYILNEAYTYNLFISDENIGSEEDF
jgi:hypothetical protein